MTDDDQTPAANRVTALTLRCGQLREQRDETRRERDAAAVERDEMAELYDATIGDQLRDERDHARAQVVACQTAADDLRATMQALAAEWWGRASEATSDVPSWRRACRELLATLGDPSATPDLLGPQIGDSA